MLEVVKDRIAQASGERPMSSRERLRRERLLEAARGYLWLRMPDHALQELNAVTDPAECACDLYQLRAEALREKKEYEAAIDAYTLALAEDPDSVSVLLGIAWCYKRTDKLPRAIAVTQQAYHVRPDESIVLYNLSCYFSLAGDKTQALSWLGRALRMDKSLRELIANEKDFDQFRDDPDFQFVAGLRDVSGTP